MLNCLDLLISVIAGASGCPRDGDVKECPADPSGRLRATMYREHSSLVHLS